MWSSTRSPASCSHRSRSRCSLSPRPSGAWLAWALSFFAFRFFDIWKPGPVDRLQDLPGGWGVVMDDVAAGPGGRDDGGGVPPGTRAPLMGLTLAPEDGVVLPGEPLARHTTWRIGGPARAYCRVLTEKGLSAVLTAAAQLARSAGASRHGVERPRFGRRLPGICRAPRGRLSRGHSRRHAPQGRRGSGSGRSVRRGRPGRAFGPGGDLGDSVLDRRRCSHQRRRLRRRDLPGARNRAPPLARGSGPHGRSRRHLARLSNVGVDRDQGDRGVGRPGAHPRVRARRSRRRPGRSPRSAAGRSRPSPTREASFGTPPAITRGA